MPGQGAAIGTQEGKQKSFEGSFVVDAGHQAREAVQQLSCFLSGVHPLLKAVAQAFAATSA